MCTSEAVRVGVLCVYIRGSACTSEAVRVECCVCTSETVRAGVLLVARVYISGCVCVQQCCVSHYSQPVSPSTLPAAPVTECPITLSFTISTTVTQGL